MWYSFVMEAEDLRFMDRKKRTFRWLWTVGIVFAVSAVLLVGYFQWKRSSSMELKQLLQSLTYSHDARIEEQELLANFKNLSALSNREKAKYYSAQTRLYGMVLGNDVQTERAFTNGMMWASRAKDWETAAWLYADYAQLFIKNSSWYPAISSLKRSLHYAQQTDMEEEYYAYCYTTLAFAYSNIEIKNIRVLRDYYEKAKPYRDIVVFADYPIDVMQDLTLARIELRERKYVGCRGIMNRVREYIDSSGFAHSEEESYIPPEMPWTSRYLLSYYQISTVLAVRQDRIGDAMRVMREGYELFSQHYAMTNFTMHFLSEVLPVVLSAENIDRPTYQELIAFASKSAVHYSSMVARSEQDAGENLYHASHATLRQINEQYRSMRLYRVISLILTVTAMIIGILSVILYLFGQRAKTDGLTGAYNRAYFEQRYLMLCERKKTFGIILYDIDCFKTFNDVHGHVFGDEVLRKVTEAVSRQLEHRHAQLYRYGGDEFVVICEKCTPQELLTIAEQMEKAVRQMRLLEDVRVTLSVGTGHTALTDDALHQADENVYAAKKKGRSCVCGSLE